MTFMRNFMDMLNIENGQEKEEPQEVLSDTLPIKKVPAPIIELEISQDIAINNNVPVTAAEEIKPKEDNEMPIDIQLEFPNEDDNKDNEDIEDMEIPYTSERMIINGVHLYFIDIAREVVSNNGVNTIPLMREYHISESQLNQIIQEIKDAGILSAENHPTMNSEELERFIDIYEPNLFKCEHTVFDKELFMCIGEIIFDNGVEDTYNSLALDEVVDYLNIMEQLKIISYNSATNKYDILSNKEDFYKICNSIPDSFSNETYNDAEVDYTNTNPDTLSGIEFEKYCAHLLACNGFSDIKLTSHSGDHGIDILADKDGIGYAIQCKCYSSNVGNAAVQQAHTGKSLYHKDIAVVMTNQHFTSQATQEADALGVKLWDRNTIKQLSEKLH